MANNQKDRRIDILGVGVDAVSPEQARLLAESWLDEPGAHTVFTPNPEMIMSAQRDADFMQVLRGGDLVVPDGNGVVWAAKKLGRPLRERVAGYDLVRWLVTRLPAHGASAYFFGGAPDVAEKAAANMRAECPDLVVCGTADGYFDAEKEAQIIADIKEKKPALLLVALGCPKQEKWIAANAAQLGARVLAGVGGTLDVMAGTVKRAPDVYIKLKIEWLYRLLKQPSRLGRMMQIPVFMRLVSRQAARQRRANGQN